MMTMSSACHDDLILQWRWTPSWLLNARSLSQHNVQHSSNFYLYFISQQISSYRVYNKQRVKVSCTKCDIPHLHYAVYHCAGYAQLAVNFVIAAVTRFVIWTSHSFRTFHSAFYLPHSTIPHFAHR